MPGRSCKPLNLMGQYQPDYEVGQIARDGSAKYAEIWRFDRRALET